MRRGLVQKTACALALAASVFAGACGDDDEPGEGGLAGLAPPDAPFYIEATIDPDDDQQAAIDSIADRFGGLEAGEQLIAAVDQLLAGNAVEATFAGDIEPWLGDNAAVFVRSFEQPEEGGIPDFGLMLEVEEPDAARDFIDDIAEQDPAPDEDRTYEGTEYVYEPGSDYAFGIVDEAALVFGSEASLKVAVDASGGEALAGSEDYDSHVAALPEDRLATAFFEPATAIEAVMGAEGIDGSEVQALQPLLGGPLSEPVAAALTAESNAASIDVAATVDSDAPTSTESILLENLPSESWFAAALPDLGPTLERNLDQISSSGLPGAGQIENQLEQETGVDLAADIFSWLGDAAVFVKGTDPASISLGLIAQTSDPEGPRKLLDSAARLIEQQSGRPSSGPPAGADYGFTFGLPPMGGGVEAGVIDDMLVAAFGATAEEVLNPAQTLGDDPRYADALAALGEEIAPALFLDLPQTIAVAEQGAADDPPGDGPDYEAIRPYVGDLGSLIAGSRRTDGLVVTRVTVTLTPQ